MVTYTSHSPAWMTRVCCPPSPLPPLIIWPAESLIWLLDFLCEPGPPPGHRTDTPITSTAAFCGGVFVRLSGAFREQWNFTLQAAVKSISTRLGGRGSLWVGECAYIMCFRKRKMCVVCLLPGSSGVRESGESGASDVIDFLFDLCQMRRTGVKRCQQPYISK